ncbi:MAG: serine protease [Chloroflexota bacterium]|nr:serine protease [Chloroflexota bacterium]
MSFWSRPRLDELLIVLVAIIIFVVYITLPDGGEEAPLETAVPTPTATAVPTEVATTPPATTAPTEAEETVAATPAVAATVTAEPAVASPDECDFVEVADDVRAAIVQVFTDFGSSGTAFHIGGGLYVTAVHVIQDEAGRTSPQITLLAGDRSFPVTVEREGSFSTVTLERDLAVLRGQAIAAVLTTRPPTDGDRDIDVRAFGYPWSSVGDSSTSGAVPLQTSKGIISAVTVANGIEIIQTDASVDRGMSGGPLVDECGVALAVASFVLSTDDVDDPGDFAAFISIAELENLD